MAVENNAKGVSRREMVALGATGAAVIIPGLPEVVNAVIRIFSEPNYEEIFSKRNKKELEENLISVQRSRTELSQEAVKYEGNGPRLEVINKKMAELDKILVVLTKILSQK